MDIDIDIDLQANFIKSTSYEGINPLENQLIADSILNHPKYAQYFKKRVCIKYVPDPK